MFGSIQGSLFWKSQPVFFYSLKETIDLIS